VKQYINLLYAESAHRPLNSIYYKIIGKHCSNEYFKALFSGWLAALGQRLPDCIGPVLLVFRLKYPVWLSLQTPVQFVTMRYTHPTDVWFCLALAPTCYAFQELHMVGKPLRIGLDKVGWDRFGSDRCGSFGGDRGGDGQKSIHQWQICWWYESIMLPVKDRLSLIISLKIAQMTSVRHEMWSYVCLSVHRWFTVAHAASLWLCWLSSYRLKLTTTSRGAGESIRRSVRRFNWFYFESHA